MGYIIQASRQAAATPEHTSFHDHWHSIQMNHRASFRRNHQGALKSTRLAPIACSLAVVTSWLVVRARPELVIARQRASES